MDKQKWSCFVLAAFFVIGFWFRLKGISTDHSFWADEAFVSSFARDIARNKSSWLQGAKQVEYEPLQTVTTAAFFSLFGVSEFSARLPAVLFGVLGIIAAYGVARRLSNRGGGLAAAFLMALSQLNLANATQAKPYAALETLLLIQAYLLIEYIDKRRPAVLFGTVIITCLACLFHILAILFWIPVAIAIIIVHRYKIKSRLRQPFAPIALVLIIGLFIYWSGSAHGPVPLLAPFRGRIVFMYNNTVYLKNILLRQYGVYLLPALLAFCLIDKKYRALGAGLIGYATALLVVWSFSSYSHNLRYLVPFFGLVFTGFGVFWGRVGDKIGERLKVKSIRWLPMLVVVVVYLSGYKIAGTPQLYYSPNLDFYGDVQNADYKNVFAWIETKYAKKLDKIAVFDDLVDTERYYLNRQSNAYFKKGTTKPYAQPFGGQLVYGTLSDFLKEKARYPQGILIIEDWHSILPEDIKPYAKKNLTLEYRGEKMAVGADRDIWPLEVRSWGME